MSGLVIDHGNPWYLSPNIWAVPTNTPDGSSPGVLSPITGQPYYLKATVHNTENFRINNAQVNLYWANPSAAITRTAAQLVCSAFVSVDGGKTADVLCLNPWIPSYVNQGHECLVAEVVQGMPSQSGALDGNNDPHVAQHNLSVVMISEKSFHSAFEVCNPERKEQVFTVQVEEAPFEEFNMVVKLFGDHLKGLSRGRIHSLGLTDSPHPSMRALQEGVPSFIQLKLGPYECTGHSVVGELEGESALDHITQAIEERPVGGLGVLILRKKEEKIK